MEPYRQRWWKSRTVSYPGTLFTCARPGRSKGADQDVPDKIVRKWIKGLPKAERRTIVSLLGRKHGPSGMSEFSFYSFYGELDTENERRRRGSFQEFVNTSNQGSPIKVLQFPTYDFKPIPLETLDTVTAVIVERLSAGETVILVDSGGETRTKAVCKYMGFIEDSATR